MHVCTTCVCVKVSVCRHVHVYVCANMSVCVCVCTYMSSHASPECARTCVSATYVLCVIVCKRVYMHVCMCLYVYVRTCTRLHVYVCTCTCLYVYSRASLSALASAEELGTNARWPIHRPIND